MFFKERVSITYSEEVYKLVLKKGCNQEFLDLVLGDLDPLLNTDTYFLAEGSLLQLHRDGVLKDSDDLDFTVNGSRVNPMVLCKYLVGKGYDLLRETKYESDVMQLAFVKNGVIVDFLFFYENGNMMYCVADHGVLFLPIRYFTDLNVEEYLELSYGKDWVTPWPEGKEYKWELECKNIFLWNKEERGGLN